MIPPSFFSTQWKHWKTALEGQAGWLPAKFTGTETDIFRKSRGAFGMRLISTIIAAKETVIESCGLMMD